MKKGRSKQLTEEEKRRAADKELLDRASRGLPLQPKTLTEAEKWIEKCKTSAVLRKEKRAQEKKAAEALAASFMSDEEADILRRSLPDSSSEGYARLIETLRIPYLPNDFGKSEFSYLFPFHCSCVGMSRKSSLVLIGFGILINGSVGLRLRRSVLKRRSLIIRSG